MTANSVSVTIVLLNIATKHGSASDRAEDLKRWRAIWPVMVSFLAGALVGTVAVSTLHNGAWAAPTAATLIVLGASWQPGDPGR